MTQIQKTCYMSAGFTGRYAVCCRDLSVNIFLMVQNEIYSQMLYLIDYVANGLHLHYKLYILREMCRGPISQHPGLATSLFNVFDMFAL